jgi:glucose/arabinose dehydrogenase
MRNCWLALLSSSATCIALAFITAASSGAAAEPRTVLTGKAAMGDWTSDAPGVRRKITVQDLPSPGSNVLAINRARVIDRPADVQLQVPPGFKINLYASGFRDPRFLLTAPNGDIFVVESRANQIRVLRDTKKSGRPDVNEIFIEHNLNKPFGIAFYPPGNEPQFLYVANTDGVIRFPYRNGDLKARGAAQQLAAHLSPGGLLRGGGHWTRDIVFSPDGKKMYVSIGSRSNVSDKAAEENRARIFEFNPDGTGQKVYAWGIRNAVGIAFHPDTDELWMSTNERDESAKICRPTTLAVSVPAIFMAGRGFTSAIILTRDTRQNILSSRIRSLFRMCSFRRIRPALICVSTPATNFRLNTKATSSPPFTVHGTG